MKPIGLLKFSEIKYLSAFLKEGELFFNTINHYRNQYKTSIENFRYDKYEGYDRIHQPREVTKLTIYGRNFKVQPDGRPILIDLSNTEYFTHICCFTVVWNKSILIDNTPRIFDPRMFDFGDSVVFISDINRFIKKIKNYIYSVGGINCLKGKIVDYLDIMNYSGEWGVFRKASIYDYQSEFRIAINVDTDKPYIIRIGSLEEFAFGPIKKNECLNIVENGNAIFV